MKRFILYSLSATLAVATGSAVRAQTISDTIAQLENVNVMCAEEGAYNRAEERRFEYRSQDLVGGVLSPNDASPNNRAIPTSGFGEYYEDRYFGNAEVDCYEPLPTSFNPYGSPAGYTAAGYGGVGGELSNELYAAIIDRWDYNSDTFLSENEVSTVLNEIGFLNALDIDNDTYLSYDEFGTGLTNDAYLSYFNTWDADRDSQLGLGEFYRGVFETWDVDESGYVEDDEFPAGFEDQGIFEAWDTFNWENAFRNLNVPTGI
ncbi:hypothetical protein ACQ4N7_14045 [Nodosilinea sp. AN01ver1]|uniref:hypothetical protein n=1 Tax=Nodosilinea sp. AN01ver1 TaxID=3423362 RepID=UPI003D31F628